MLYPPESGFHDHCLNIHLARSTENGIMVAVPPFRPAAAADRSSDCAGEIDSRGVPGRRNLGSEFYRWRKEYGGLDLDQARRMKELEKENSRLKRLVADLSIEKQVLKEIAEGNS
jgi:hypothetical protein